ncbi:UPF0178 protein [Novosphingobium marinum]|uniref:UPF0178 protein FHS75_002359 n=1 Tax=Novosphingobium marinum TaxID=1514948 RepID=A0A7Y9XWU8_9SPHN|nr:DUF188 domain-containing protein [Novosphingobium marinum]NYH96027.1 hypothetical protein [Novosphingobium marinum]GGC31855.1 UPF0178 protein [Novosphingobium marinum]
MSKPVTILVDADACPVKEEVYRVADRHEAHVRVVSNSPFRVPVSERVRRVVVDGYAEHISGDDQSPASATAPRPVRPQPSGPGSEAEPAEPGHSQRPASEGPKYDAADDWIAEHADERSVVVTGDILLAERCLKAGARVLKHDGREFDAASIGSAIATRAIMEDLRAGMDGVGGGPPPFGKADRSRFLQALDRVLVGMGK